MDADDCILSQFIRKDKAAVDAYRLFRVRRTVFQMLRDRGYALSDADLADDFEGFQAACGEPVDLRTLTVVRIHPSAGKIIVFFFGGDSFKVAHLREYLVQCNREGASRMIIAYRNSITSLVRKAVKESESTIKVELFHMSDLLCNPMEHVLMPKHEILTAEEKEKLLDEYKINENQMPRMLLTDMVARYHGLERGQVVKVTYSGEITKSHVTYRCVT
ncbi:DNA-directed RNA polymerases IV and V subunit 5B [Nymphaea thermarum]|nr:DNA-directed RNA polymerases IV and V subunit 5B [Nymphaea thermarum]